MKMTSLAENRHYTSSGQNQAFTRIDLAVTVVTIGLLTMLLVHAHYDPFLMSNPNRLRCVDNLKNVGLAFRIWANDNNDKFPMQVEAKSGGSQEAIATGETFSPFRRDFQPIEQKLFFGVPQRQSDGGSQLQQTGEQQRQLFRVLGCRRDQAPKVVVG
jgi:hypothetical protein